MLLDGGAPLPKNTRFSSVALFASNLAPLAGVLLFGWDVFILMLLFWLENVIIGVMNILRMIACKPGSIAENISKFIFVPFFTVHYGGFCAGHGIFIFALFGDTGLNDYNPTPGALLATTQGLLSDPALLISVVALTLSHFLSFILNFLLGGEYKTTGVGELMARPYARIVLLHLVIIIGGGLAMAAGQHVVALAMLVILKTGMDLWAHRKEHKKLARTAER